MNDHDAIKIGKYHIDNNNFDFFEEYEGTINPFVFQKLFSHCCIKGNFDIAKLLYERVYMNYEIVDRIGLRPTFAHYKYLAKDKKFKKWLDQMFHNSKC